METRKIRAYRIELLVIDFDGIGEDDITDVIETTRYPSHCISPQVKRVESREVDWNDNHPLNKRDTCDEAYADLFGKE